MISSFYISFYGFYLSDGFFMDYDNVFGGYIYRFGIVLFVFRNYKVGYLIYLIWRYWVNFKGEGGVLNV